MTDEMTALLREALSILRRLEEYQTAAADMRRSVADSLKKEEAHRDISAEAHRQRMSASLAQAQAEADQRRRDEMEFRERVFAELAKQSSLLTNMSDAIRRMAPRVG